MTDRPVMTTTTNPIHDGDHSKAAWTRVNAAEAMPGVATPLSWTWFHRSCERALRGAFADIGALRADDVDVPADLDRRFVGMFCGRFAGNLDMMRFIGDQMPGSSGEAVEEQYFSSTRPVSGTGRDPSRLLAVLTKLPVNAWRAQRDIRRLEEPTDRWWRQSVADGSTTSLEGAREVLRESRSRVERIVRIHTVNSMIGQGLFEQVRRACDRAGHAGLEFQLVSGDGGAYETAMLQGVWEAAHGKRELASVLLEHGFHGPEEGQLHSRSWREDPGPLEAILDGYRRSTDMPARARPEQAAGRRQAEATLLAGLSRLQRARATQTLRLARHVIPLRELGRSNFLKGYDVARCMARRIGQHLVEGDVLDDPEDVFYLTIDEVLDGLPTDPRAVVAERRRVRDGYLTVELPESWDGGPEPRPIGADETSPGPSSGAVTGVAASPGVAEGRAVVLLDPHAAGELDDGDILVCQTTDPSWASIFFLVDACVIDTGGAMSHGAIVARELGIPCVIGTKDGTRRLRTGDRVRVDGDRGTVELIG